MKDSLGFYKTLFYSKLDRLRFYLPPAEIEKWEKKFDCFSSIMINFDLFEKF